MSHWDGTINWPAVAASGKKFVIAKATQGVTFVDPMYLINRRGAMAAGLRFTAYDYAAPNTTAGGAIADADYFVRNAQLTSGNLIPALDLETTGGLGVDALKTWVRAWLDEVSLRLGVKPMIYTSPSFWQTYMGNATSFAAGGYKVLWIAHWGVSAPSVPAQNWGGNGWTFWQYTSSGTVPGIYGRVDLDWYRFTYFTKVSIP